MPKEIMPTADLAVVVRIDGVSKTCEGFFPKN